MLVTEKLLLREPALCGRLLWPQHGLVLQLSCSAPPYLEIYEDGFVSNVASCTEYLVVDFFGACKCVPIASGYLSGRWMLFPPYVT